VSPEGKRAAWKSGVAGHAPHRGRASQLAVLCDRKIDAYSVITSRVIG
jgi:hypothetical protein